MPEQVVDSRLDCLVSALTQDHFDPVKAVCQRLADEDESELQELLDDLSAAKHVPVDGERSFPQQAVLKRRNGMFYLLTYPVEDMQLILGKWREDASTTVYFGEYLPTCPSKRRGLKGRRSIRRLGLRSEKACAGRLRRCRRGDRSGDLVGAARRKRVKNRPVLPDNVAKSVAETVADFWEEHWDRLTCGFPYYGFRSRLPWWWSKSAGWWLKRHIPAPEPSRRSGDSSLSFEQLRTYREGLGGAIDGFRAEADQTPHLRGALDDLGSIGWNPS